jgi:opacity protein-like surface antigen
MLGIGLAASPQIARADTLITPFTGVTFGGDAQVHRPAFGAGVTFAGRSIGLEVELARIDKFFGDDETSADVTTLTAALVGGADLHGPGAKPYFLAGVGLLRTGVQLGALLDDTSYNNFAIVLGGGLNVLVTDHLGFRGDLRYFRRLERQSDIGIIPIASNFDFWRATVGLNLHF